jgi:hypothetical protein
LPRLIVDSSPQATGGDDEDDGADANASYSAVFCALGEDQVRVSESADVADLFSNFIRYSQPKMKSKLVSRLSNMLNILF